jgi:hypothetical protein
MKSIIISILVCIFIVALGIQNAAAKALHDDFAGNYLDSSKWNDGEFVRKISQGKLLSKVGNTTNEGGARNNTQFKNPSSINTIECDISINVANLDSGTDPVSLARVDGRFYNSQNSGTERGDIWAGLYIGDQGNGLEVWWRVAEATDDAGNNWDDKGTGTLNVPGLAFNQAYTAKIDYDGANGFTFTVAGVSSTFTGPVRQGDEFTEYKALETLVYSEGGIGNGYVSASFDNIYINDQGAVYDDFSTIPLDQTKWTDLEFVREIENGKLRLSSHGTENTESTRINLTVASAYTEATITIKDESVISSGSRGRTRISGEYYNDTYGPGSHNGYEGDVYAQVYINYNDDGTLQANCYAERAGDAEWTTWQELFYQAFNLPIFLERAYTLSLRFTGSMFIFTIKDTVTGREEFYVYEVETDVNEASIPNVQIISRAYGNGSSAYMTVDIDNVYVDVGEPAATYNATGEWSLTDSNPWSEGGCELPYIGDTTDATFTQNGNDFTVVVHEDEGDSTFTGRVFGNSYYSIKIEEENGDTETLYIIFTLSQTTSGAGGVTAHETDGIDECYLGFNIAFNKYADTDGDGTQDNLDTDDDNDGVLDVDDAFPLDDTETLDTDEDGTGNNADTDDDNDGISDVTEAAGPNSGDANNDGTLDSLQNNVASVKEYNAQGYVVLETPTGTVLSSCQVAENPSPGDAPVDVNFDYGFFGFTISGIAVGGSTTLTMTLPSGVIVDTYYRHGKTPDNQVNHWYEFLYDGETGAEINNNVITFHFVDALRGDDILTQDSMVIDLGGPGFNDTVAGGGSGSGGGGCFILTTTQ